MENSPTSLQQAKQKLTLSQVKIRPANEKDVGFIFNSWLKSYKSSRFAKFLPNIVYFSSHHKLIEKLIAKNTVSVACNIADENQIYGYVCAEEVEGALVVHYVYIKDTFRKLNCATLLLQSLGNHKAFFYSHNTQLASTIVLKKYSNCVYNPYLAF
jgi:hypothetical protein